jgi:CBS domain-containing protein
MNSIAQRSLETTTLDAVAEIDRPQVKETLTLDDSASEVFIDFQLTMPPMLEADTSVNAAQFLMEREHATLKLVIGRDETFRGVITQVDICSSKLLRVCNATGIPRSELTVAEVMTPREQLHAVRMPAFMRASVGRVLDTLQRLGEQYLLIVDEESSRIRGLICARDITRRLHLRDIDSGRANSFVDLVSTLNKP